MISVLYVDDEPTLLEVTQLFLERSGEFRVDLATSATDALKLPALLTYDAVVADYQMPDMDGIGLLKEIRSRSADIPFILFTGKGREDVVIEAINNGADFYLQKGGDPTAQFAELKHKIKKAVERRRAKDALMESAEQYRLLAENSPEMIYIVDTNGSVRYVNSIAARQFNAPPDAITGKHLSEIFPAPVAMQHLDVIRQVISSKKPIHHETQEETPAGALWIDVHLAPVIDHTGAVVAVLGLSNDITDRKRAEEALLDSEDRFKTLFERSADAQLLLDATGTVADCNAAFLVLFALKEKDEVRGHSPADFAPEYQPDGVRSTQRGDEILQSVIGKGTVRYEWAHQKHDAVQTPILTEVICTVITIAGQPMIHASIRDITDRRRTEEALCRNETLYRTLVESTSDMVWEVDKDGRYTYVSPVIRTLLGFEPDEVIGRTPFDLMPQGEAERVRTAFSECVAARMPIVRMENTNIHKDGHRVILETSGEPVLDTAGTLTGYRGIDRDITERRRAEEALRESEERYRLIVSNSEFPVVVTGLSSGRVLFANECAFRLFGVSQSELRDLRAQDFWVHPGDRDRFIHDLISKGKLSNYETALRATDGTLRWTLVGASIIDFGGEKAAFIVYNDITARKRMEDALRENEQKYRQLVELAREGIWTIDAGAVTTYVNPTMARMLGYTTDEMIGRHLFSFMDDRGQEIATRNIEPRQQGISEQHDFEFLKKDGSRIYARLSTSPLTDAAGTYQGALAVVADITEQRKAEDALRETNKKLNLLSSITRHDVLNMLTTLQGFIELSGECFSGEETFRSFADKELMAVSEIQRIISFTKEYEEIGVRSPEWQDIRDVLRKAAGWLDWSGVDVRIQVSGYIIYADPLLEKVFYNLLDNSLRHGQTVTSLQVSASETANGLVIVCQDDGTGIPSGEKEKIFGRGYGRHSGFGLFLAREILGITGISIRETGQPGAGARFEILIPRGAYRTPG